MMPDTFCLAECRRVLQIKLPRNIQEWKGWGHWGCSLVVQLLMGVSMVRWLICRIKYCESTLGAEFDSKASAPAHLYHWSTHWATSQGELVWKQCSVELESTVVVTWGWIAMRPCLMSFYWPAVLCCLEIHECIRLLTQAHIIWRAPCPLSVLIVPIAYYLKFRSVYGMYIIYRFPRHGHKLS